MERRACRRALGGEELQKLDTVTKNLASHKLSC